MGIIFACVVAAVYFYNRLVKLKQMVEEAFSGIDVQLKRRANLIPSLVEVVKAYAGHEQSVFEDVSEKRSQSLGASATDVKAREVIEEGFAQSIGKLMAVVENYPDLKAVDNFAKLQDELVAIEDELQMARRYYNGSVRNMNIAVHSFPSNLVARLGAFQEAQFFELENALDRLVPKVELEE